MKTLVLYTTATRWFGNVVIHTYHILKKFLAQLQ